MLASSPWIPWSLTCWPTTGASPEAKAGRPCLRSDFVDLEGALLSPAGTLPRATGRVFEIGADPHPVGWSQRRFDAGGIYLKVVRIDHLSAVARDQGTQK